jgi:hypothetical protein
MVCDHCRRRTFVTFGPGCAVNVSGDRDRSHSDADLESRLTPRSCSQRLNVRSRDACVGCLYVEFGGVFVVVFSIATKFCSRSFS